MLICRQFRTTNPAKGVTMTCVWMSKETMEGLAKEALEIFIKHVQELPKDFEFEERKSAMELLHEELEKRGLTIDPRNGQHGMLDLALKMPFTAVDLSITQIHTTPPSIKLPVRFPSK